ncbi:MAG: ATP-binding cassette domain-containing protein [Bacteroidota bacterium]
MNFLEVKNVVKKYAAHTALNNVSIDVPENTIFGLLGPNGAGKTSLIRIINQITAPDSGKILLNGELLKPSDIEIIGYLPEERGLYKKMKVGEQALYLAQLKGVSNKEAMIKLKYWFEKFEIQSWWHKKVEELSKGMQQKVQFIVTIIHDPKLLILDEPFSGFDPINTNLIKNEILKLKENGATVILSTHNMSSVEELCDNIALINKSQVILSGKVSEIRKSYRSNTYQFEIEGEINNFIHNNSSQFELIEEIKYADSTNFKVKLANNYSQKELISSLIQQFDIISFHEVLPNMNDIFIQRVQGNNSANLIEL